MIIALVPYVPVFPSNIAVYEGSSNFSFSCAPYPIDNKIKGNSFKVDNSNNSVLMANENGLLPAYSDAYDLSYVGFVRIITYKKSTDAYTDHLYHECVLNTASHRATITVLCK